jgi:type IV pilus assembly protein PilO
MKALYSVTGHVPLGRIVREHRAALFPLGIVLAVNLIALVGIVLPLSARVASSEQRAETAERQRTQAEAEFKRAETLRQAQTEATVDLETFYAEVLPANVAAARRILQLRLQQSAREHGVNYRGSGTTEETLHQSNLLRMSMSVRLSGEYDDIRAFIYELETSPAFVVIDNLRLAAGAESDAPLAVSLQVSTYYRTGDAAAHKTGGNGR